MFFLEEVAQKIFNQHQGDFEKVCVILPSRRACFYFKNHLANQSESPFISPEIYAIDDFVMRMSGLKKIDQTTLIFETFDVFKEISPEVEFNKFMAWGTTLLTDFDAIDQNMTKTSGLFSYMTAAKAIERWNTDLLAINKAKFESNEVTDKYFQLFENINHVYENLRNKLLKNQQVYRGLAYRHLAENRGSLLIDNQQIDMFHFVGLNALSESEKTFITTLQTAKRAQIYWDVDKYLLNNRQVLAGKVLRKYKENLTFGPIEANSDELLTGKKKIRLFPCQTNAIQAKLAGFLYNKMIEEDDAKIKIEQNEDSNSVSWNDEMTNFESQNYKKDTSHYVETVIVLNDETMLQPLLFGLNENIDDINITMGVTLKQSVIYTFVTAWFELQMNMVEINKKDSGEKILIKKFNHRLISKLLRHPLVRLYELEHFEGDHLDPKPENPILAIFNNINQQKNLYLSEDEIKEIAENDTLTKIIFKRWTKPQETVEAMKQIVEIFKSVYENLERKDAIETEFLYLFGLNLTRIEDTILNRKELTISSLKVFINEFFRTIRIPFSGEPIAKLQIMSMLETRTLDFKRVILMSMNEGVLPAKKRQNSLIPFDAAMEYNLPIHTEQDAIMAYHFFRLLQRAEQVDILYLENSSEGKAERSRFVMQLEHHLQPLNQNIDIQVHNIKIQTENEYNFEELEIKKTEVILNKIKEFLTVRGLSSTSLNTFINCKLKFYFTEIAKLKEDKELSETIDDSSIGNWIHQVLEEIDHDYTVVIDPDTGNESRLPFQKKFVKEIIKELPERVERSQKCLFKNLSFEYGMNKIKKNSVIKMLKNFWVEQEKRNNFPLAIIGMEKKIVEYLTISTTKEDIVVKMKGTIDRLEFKENELTIADYKTGKAEKKDLVIKKDITFRDKFDEVEYGNDKFRQAWFYKYLIGKKIASKKGFNINGQQYNLNLNDLQSRIYAFRKIKEDISVNISIQDEGNKDFLTYSDDLIKEIVLEMLNENQIFQKTTNKKTCDFCDFTRICGITKSNND